MARARDESAQLLLAEVGDADGANEALVHEFFHRAPGVENRRGHLVSANTGDGPVDEVQVEVVEAKVSEGLAEGGLDTVRGVLCVPELGGDEDVLAR